MGILKDDSKNDHWSYFLSIEQDLVNLSRYVEFSTSNYQTYSIEIARLIISSVSEIDVILKMICKREFPEKNASNINAYYSIITEKLPKLISFEVRMPRWGLYVRPWELWKQGVPPKWWTANNKIKHHRHSNFYQANLFNLLKSLSALFVVNLFLDQENTEQGKLLPMPLVCRPGRENFGGTTFNDFEFGINYKV